jgi:hypothetical protein
VHLDLQDGAHSLLELAYNYQLAHGTYLEKIVSTVSLVQVLLCLITRGMHCRACSNRLPPYAVLCNRAIKEGGYNSRQKTNLNPECQIQIGWAGLPAA